ncbi:hypothetical protein ACH5AO_36620 [Streptomyces sp. NPDC018964]|uniref:hypothetical protein n=1 Tax=Streptomyces sp. NPDC018964 TaxID=3365058 RepID=UPI00379685A3
MLRSLRPHLLQSTHEDRAAAGTHDAAAHALSPRIPERIAFDIFSGRRPWRLLLWSAADTTAHPAARRPALMPMPGGGVVNDWSVLHPRNAPDAPDATAALACGAPVTAPAAGRFSADRAAGRLGPAAVLRRGVLTAALGTGPTGLPRQDVGE